MIGQISEEQLKSGIGLREKINAYLCKFSSVREADPKTMKFQSNSILQLLDGLIRAYRLEIDRGECAATPKVCEDGSTVNQYTHHEYGIPVTVHPPKQLPEDPEMMATVMEFEAKGSDLSYAFTRFCKNQGMSNPYPTASIFSARLKNERSVLQKAGWELVTKDSETMYFKTVRGQHVFKFRHTFIR